jgi:outer membrane lipoprotein-sorting protein
MHTVPSILAFLATFLALAAQSHAAPADPELLERIAAHRTAHPEVSMRFTETKQLRLLNRPVTIEGILQIGSEGRFRREVTGSNPSTTVCTGSKIYIHYPVFGETETYDLDASPELRALVAALTAGLRFQDLESLYDVTCVTPTPPAAHSILLVPRRADIRRILTRLEIDLSEDLLVIRTAYDTPRGDRITTTYSGHSLAPLPEGTFSLP